MHEKFIIITIALFLSASTTARDYDLDCTLLEDRSGVQISNNTRVTLSSYWTIIFYDEQGTMLLLKNRLKFDTSLKPQEAKNFEIDIPEGTTHCQASFRIGPPSGP